MDKATEENMKMMFKVMKYIKNTNDHCIAIRKLNYDKKLPWKMNCYRDSDWEGDGENRKSITGWIILIGDTPIGWVSLQKQIFSLSSSEAEYVELAEVSKEILFILHLLEFMGVKVELPITVHVDNKGAIFISENPVVKRTKHIGTRYHMIRKLVKDDIIIIKFVTSDENLADIFTKNTSVITFHCHFGGLMTQVYLV